jgi:hypothetical protein
LKFFQEYHRFGKTSLKSVFPESSLKSAMKEFGNKELYLELATDTKEELGGNQI